MAISQKIQKKVKDIIAWIGAYSRLVELETKYFELSIAQGLPFSKDGKFTFKYSFAQRTKYRRISEQYGEGVSNLIKKLP